MKISWQDDKKFWEKLAIFLLETNEFILRKFETVWWWSDEKLKLKKLDYWKTKIAPEFSLATLAMSQEESSAVLLWKRGKSSVV